MCGISGAIALKGTGISLKKLQEMNDIVSHRGPDDKGFALFDANGSFGVSSSIEGIDKQAIYVAGLGHRRLSILDLSSRGHQPMFDQSERYCIVYNGEIYNYMELRSDLISRGSVFTSNTDTEVILESYKVWGVDCLKRFNGMWSFAIYDRTEKTLFCSRDNFGIKPFYYSFIRDEFVFGSEIKQLQQYLGTPSGINDKILSDYLFWGYETHTDDTFFKNINSLTPGHYIVINLKRHCDVNCRPVKYWYEQTDKVNSERDVVDTFRELFIDSVRIRLRSDVPVGTTLSGGLDSSSVACAIKEVMNGGNQIPLPKMFTSVYSDVGYSEKTFADAVVKKTGFKHICIHPTATGVQKFWNKLIWHMEEPFGSLTYYSNWNVYEKCKQEGVPVILNGQGGDELLLGYERYRTAYFRTLLRSYRISKIISEFYKIKKNANISFAMQILNMLYFTFPIIKILRASSMVKPYLTNEYYHAYKDNTYSVRDEIDINNLMEMQIKEFNKYQLQHLLHHEDRISMAFSIEARLPFLDYRLYNLVLGMDDQLKLNAGWSKYILRQAMSGYIPEIIKNRVDKMGFDTPTKRLLLENRDFYTDVLKRNINDKHINVKNVLRDYISGEINESLLCRIFTFISWKETFQM